MYGRYRIMQMLYLFNTIQLLSSTILPSFSLPDIIGVGLKVSIALFSIELTVWYDAFRQLLHRTKNTVHTGVNQNVRITMVALNRIPPQLSVIQYVS